MSDDAPHGYRRAGLGEDGIPPAIGDEHRVVWHKGPGDRTPQLVWPCGCILATEELIAKGTTRWSQRCAKHGGPRIERPIIEDGELSQ